MVTPLNFLLGTLQGIRGAFARFLRGVFPLPSVATLAGQIRARVRNILASDAIIAAEKLLGARRAALAMNSPPLPTSPSGLLIPTAPLFDIPQASPGDIVAEVYVEMSSTDNTDRTDISRASQIIVVDQNESPFNWDSVVADIVRETGSPTGIGQIVTISTQYNWVFQIDTLHV